MKKFSWKFAFIFGLTAAGLVAIWDYGLKRGIDLSGGTILVYQVRADARADSSTMDDLVAALKKRINPEGVSDTQIRKVGNNRLEIILPEASPEQVDEIKRLITNVGSLEFRILANQKHDKAAIDRMKSAPGATLPKPPARYDWALLGSVFTGENPKFDANKVYDPRQQWARNRFSDRTEVVLTGKDYQNRPKTLAVSIEGNTATAIIVDPRKAREPGELGDERPRYFNIGGLTTAFQSISSYRIDYNPSRISPENPQLGVREVVRGPGWVDRYVLVNLDRQNVTGEHLARVFSTQDERLQPAVGFTLNGVGARKFGALTGDHQPEENGAFMYHLAVLLDKTVVSAPVIRSQIRDNGIIEGMPVREKDFLIRMLHAGSLPASLDPTPLSEETIGPTLGKDTIEKGVRAIAISMLVVPIFMVVYYRFAGVVAVVALVLNMILLVASMAATGSSFTLPGLAGLALTIGMAVDANVLIFERIREEAERGASMAQQIRNGFSRAWTTILDSNVTTMLSGAVLWAIGTEEIKGFALTLIIGLIWNLFTAVYVSRIIFEFWYSRGWLKKLTMMKLMDRTNIDFAGPRRYFMAASTIVIVLGLAAYFAQGNKMYNIDFTGGTLVTIQLNPEAPALRGQSEGQRAEYVRRQAGAVLRDPSVETLNVRSERAGTRFNIRTTESNLQQVRAKILKQFGETLARPSMTASAPAAIPPAPTGEAAKTAPIERFAGGRRYELTFNRAVNAGAVRNAFAEVLRAAKVSNPENRFEVLVPRVGDEPPGPISDRLTLKTDLDAPEAATDLARLGQSLRSDPSLLFERLENFSGSVAADARTYAAIAVVASWLIMIAYLWVRFKSVTYGFAAVIALVHDVLITMGAVAISPYKIDLPMVAAFLTLIGFSVNDTIVIFDRIREIKGRSPYLTTDLVNAAINQTLSRTILTSFTAWLVVVIMYFFGGEGLHGFSFCLVVGFLSGTYSTIYIASPILIDWTPRPPAPRSEARAKPAMAGREA